MGSFNHIGVYECECGKKFENSQAFNGHKSSCLVHRASNNSVEYYEQIKKIASKKRQYKLIKRAEENKVNELQKWINEKHICENCRNVMYKKFGSGRFCCRNCSNSRKQSQKSKNKISKTLKESQKNKNTNNGKKLQHIKEYNENPKFCKICNKQLLFENRYRKTCSKECLHKILHNNGMISIQIQGDSRRSKNEILFCKKCNEYFKNVEHNKPIFDGWDADIIIHDIKLAVLWNGIWHIKQITKQHSLKQVKIRDKIKNSKILNMGYTPYIIVDIGSFNEKFVTDEFNKLLDSIKNKVI
jgi:ribosomal protein L37AE/L43A